MTAIHHRSPIATLDGAQRVALDQAATLAKQAERIQELISERDAARYRQDEAFALAAEYARRGGLDITHDQIAGQLEHEQRLLTHYDRRNHALEGFHHSVWQLHVLLQRRANGLTFEEVRKLVKHLGQLLDTSRKDKPGPREKSGQTALFDAALEVPARGDR